MSQNKYALLIPTYNRPFTLRRVLEYYAKNKLDAPVYVLDSSLPGFRERNKEVIREFTSLLSLEYKEYSIEVQLQPKMLDVLGTLKEPLCVVCADDDLIIHSSLRVCADFLEEHPDYTCAQGVAFGFSTVRESTGSWRFELVGGHYGENIDENDALIRFRKHLLNYRPTFYGVHRSHELKAMLEKLRYHPWDGFFAEMVLTSCTVLWGKVKRVEVPFEFRDSNEIIQDPRDNISWGHLITTRDYSEKFWAFQNCIADEMVLRTGCKREDAVELIREVWIYFIQKVLQRWYGEKSVSPSKHSPLVQHALGIVRNFPLVGKMYDSLRRGASQWTQQEPVMLGGKFNDEIDFLKKLVLEHAPAIYDARSVLKPLKLVASKASC